MQSASDSVSGTDETPGDEVLVVCDSAWTYPTINEMDTNCGHPARRVSTTMLSLGALMLQDIVQWPWIRRIGQLVSGAIQDFHGLAATDEQILLNAVTLQNTVIQGRNLGAWVLRNAWGYVWFALDNCYCEKCGHVVPPATIPARRHVLDQCILAADFA